MNRILTVILLLNLTCGLAQDATSNKDLRKQYELFVLKCFEAKRIVEYKMISSLSGQYNFQVIEDGKVKKQKKLSFADAQLLDEKFVDKFISFKYLMKANLKDVCKDAFYLNLRGEELVICQSETEKNKEMNEFTKSLKNMFL